MNYPNIESALRKNAHLNLHFGSYRNPDKFNASIEIDYDVEAAESFAETASEALRLLEYALNNVKIPDECFPLPEDHNP